MARADGVGANLDAALGPGAGVVVADMSGTRFVTPRAVSVQTERRRGCRHHHEDQPGGRYTRGGTGISQRLHHQAVIGHRPGPENQLFGPSTVRRARR
jgi:hypothetical protein